MRRENYFEKTTAGDLGKQCRVFVASILQYGFAGLLIAFFCGQIRASEVPRTPNMKELQKPGFFTNAVNSVHREIYAGFASNSAMGLILTVPPDLTVECDAIPPVQNPSATTDCPNTQISLSIAEEVQSGNCADNFTIRRIWTATDMCGNVQTKTQTIIVQDTKAPDIRFRHPLLLDLEDGDTLYLNCANPLQFGLQDAAAVDNCDPEPAFEFVDYVIRVGDCPEDGYRMLMHCGWEAEDRCGNKSSISFIFIVIDTVAPVIGAIPDTISIDCHRINQTVPLPVTDDCGQIFVNFKDVIMPGNCTGEMMIMREWIVNDDCGNYATKDQVILVRDTIAPHFTGVPADTVFDCTFVIPPAQHLPVIDNCDTALVQTIFETVSGNSCSKQIIRRWIVKDDCENTDTLTQVITVVDTTAPRLIHTPPAELVVSCDAPLPVDDPVFEDDCHPNLNLSAISTFIPLDCGFRIEKKWTAVDSCGNENSFSQVIIGIDTTAPTLINVPADIDVECHESPPLPPTVTASDNCDLDVTVHFSEEHIGTACLDLRIVRTWSAEDDCGNQVIGSQVIRIVDIRPPILLNVPADTTLECDEVIPEPFVIPFDNCDTFPQLDFQETTSADDCNFFLTRTWTATDRCGNSTVQSQLITVSDFTNPEIEFSNALLIGRANGDTIFIECDSILFFQIGDVHATDNCTMAPLVSLDIQNTESADCALEGFHNFTRYTWTAADICGNTASISIVVVALDRTPPVFVETPEDVTIECDENYPPLPVITATDNCDGNVAIIFDEQIEPSSCDARLIRTWTATDDCGNQTSISQVIHVIDIEGPVAVIVPPDVTIECDEPDPSEVPVFQDVCSTTILVNVSNDTSLNICGFTVYRTWTATDGCGNTTEVTRRITVTDTTPPVFTSIPADTTISCDQTPVVPNVEAVDNCSPTVAITFVENTTGSGTDCDLHMVREWTATDLCGNAATITQIVAISDHEQPVLEQVPSDTTVSCDAIPAPTDPTATDNCDTDLAIVFQEESLAGNCPDSYTVIRTWSATDDCGNTTIQSQRITVVDTTSPVIEFVHPDLIGKTDGDTIFLECRESLEFTENDVTATDNCSDPVVTLEEDIFSSVDCIADGFIQVRTFTWTAIDDCGNDSSLSIIIVTIDQTPPIFIHVPADMLIECHQPLPNPASVQAIDNCNDPVLVTLNEQQLPGTCPQNFTVIRNWTATDFCGNTASVSQTILVIDNLPPVIEGVPNDTILSCENAVLPPSVTATDACDDQVQVIFDELRVDGNCPGNFTLLRSWFASDACGNTSLKTQAVQVFDQSAPFILGLAGYLDQVENGDTLYVECNALILPDTSDVSAIDNCDPMPQITFENSILSTGDCINDGYFSRSYVEWRATDHCGNTSVFSIYITVVDTEPPVLSGVPGHLQLNCDDLIPDPANVTAIDNCSGNVFVEYTDSFEEGSCIGEYSILREWKATDDCGNVATATQLIELLDREAPIIVIPADTLYSECNNVPGIPVADISDNCSTFSSIFEEEVIDFLCEFSYTIERRWTATDGCGNISTKHQTVIVRDTLAPEIVNIPFNQVVECDEIPGLPTIEELELVDNCDPNPSISFQEERIGTPCIDLALIRTWTVSDQCNNVGIYLQTIILEDTTPPVFVNPVTEFTVQCDAVDDLPIPDVEDNCDEAFVLQKTDVITPGPCEQEYTLTRTWRATDVCGNWYWLTQTVHVIDTTAPDILLDVPGIGFVEDGDTLVIACDQLNPMDANTADVKDNCGNVQVIFNEQVTVSDSCQAEGFRTYLFCEWVATDECGNSDSLAIHIFLIDTVGPVMVNVPPNLLVRLYAGDTIPGLPQVLALDNCGVDQDPGFKETTEQDDCGFTINRTWSATDECGNLGAAEQVIRVTALIEIDSIVFKEATCGNQDGFAGIYAAGDMSDFVITWQPNLGTPNAANNERTDLPPGIYFVTLYYPGYEECIQVVPFEIGDGCLKSVRDTMFIAVNDVETRICLDSTILENRSSITDVFLCNAGNAATVLANDLFDNCFTLTPRPGFAGVSPDTICLIHCFTNLECDTTLIIASVPLSSQPCDKFDPVAGDDSYLYLPNRACDKSTELCLNIAPPALGEFSFLLNGRSFGGQFRPCDYERLTIYSFATLPGKGSSGPYRLEAWLINGQIFSGTFADLADLLRFMNKIDEQGKWVKGEQDFVIIGGNPNHTYGGMRIVHVGSGVITVQQSSTSARPNGTAMLLPIGHHDLVVTDLLTGCRDTTKVGIYCLTSDDLVLETAIHDNDTLCIDLSELSGSIESVKGSWENTPAGCVDIEWIPDLECIRFTGMVQGVDRVSLVICDENGLCDTTFITVYVRESHSEGEEHGLIFYNGFSPNGDGINDYYTIGNLEYYPGNQLTVFNRWGAQILKVKNYQNDWDGTWQQVDLPVGVYFYVLDDGKGKVHSGYIQLSR